MKATKSFLKTDKTELYEEMEKDNNNTNLISKNKTKKKGKNTKIKYIVLIIIIIIITLLFFSYLIIKRKKFSKISLEPIFSLYYEKNNIIRNRKAHLDFAINSISIFPSGNIIAYDYNMIILYDTNFNILQEIYAFEDEFNLIKDLDEQKVIINIEIIDENNFILITNYGNLNLYTKEKGKFILKKENLIRNEKISCIVFDSKDNIYALSNDSIKIFNKNKDDNYTMSKKVLIPNMTGRKIYAYFTADKILLLEDKNIIIVKQSSFIIFFKIVNNDSYKLIYIFEEKNINLIETFDEDKLIVLCNNDNLKIISIYENKVFKNIKIEMGRNILKYHKEKGIIVLGTTYQINKGVYCSRIKVLRSDNFEVIQTIEEEKNDFMNGIFILNNGSIGAYYYRGIKIWRILEN